MAQVAEKVKVAIVAPPKKFDVDRILRVDYTDREMQDMGIELARKHKTAAQLALEKKAIVRQMDEKISRVEADISSASSSISDGFHMESVECNGVIDYANDSYTVTRSDTGEVIEERRLKDSERQIEMSMEEEAVAGLCKGAEATDEATEPAEEGTENIPAA